MIHIATNVFFLIYYTSLKIKKDINYSLKIKKIYTSFSKIKKEKANDKNVLFLMIK